MTAESAAHGLLPTGIRPGYSLRLGATWRPGLARPSKTRALEGRQGIHLGGVGIFAEKQGRGPEKEGSGSGSGVAATGVAKTAVDDLVNAPAPPGTPPPGLQSGPTESRTRGDFRQQFRLLGEFPGAYRSFETTSARPVRSVGRQRPMGHNGLASTSRRSPMRETVDGASCRDRLPAPCNAAFCLFEVPGNQRKINVGGVFAA